MRLKGWQLQIVVNSTHRLANAASIALGDLKEERFVLRTYCESTSMVLDFLRAQGGDHSFQVPARTGRNDAEVRIEVLNALATWIETVV